MNRGSLGGEVGVGGLAVVEVGPDPVARLREAAVVLHK
jgi:hypothetical protein